MGSHIGRLLSTAAIATLASLPAQAQTDSEVWRAYEEKIKPAVFCIRKTSLYEVPLYSPIDGALTSAFKERVSHGSGVVFESEQRNDRTEYRILTNNHVVDAEVNINGARLVYTTYALVDNSDDKDPKDDIVVKEDIRNPDHDQAILITSGASDLPIASISRLGASSLQQGDRLFTTGFPGAVAKTSVDGKLSAADYDDPGLLPFPGKVYAANIPIDPGQSGSPVLRPVVGKKGEIDFELIGLVYAKDPSSDQVRLITPIAESSPTLNAIANIPSRHPSLEATVTGEMLDRLSQDRAGITAIYNIDDYKAIIKPMENSQDYVIRHFREVGGILLQNEMLDFHISTLPAGGVTITKIANTKDGVTATHDVVSDRQRRLDKYATAVVNHFEVQRDLAIQASISTPTTEQTRYTDYVRSVVVSQAEQLAYDAWAIYSQLYRDGVISQQFK